MAPSTSARHYQSGKSHHSYNSHYYHSTSGNGGSNSSSNNHLQHGNYAQGNTNSFTHHHHSTAPPYPHAPPAYYHGGCKYETALAHFRRRMPYYIGMEPLPPVDLTTIKSQLTPEEDTSLTDDMNRLYQMLLPNPESDVRKEKFLVKLEHMLNQRWPGHSIKLRIFGSSGNKLCSSESD
ncbi:hypothetical protein KEM56_005470, partial [Ascosphaera pollenicola]